MTTGCHPRDMNSATSEDALRNHPLWPSISELYKCCLSPTETLPSAYFPQKKAAVSKGGSDIGTTLAESSSIIKKWVPGRYQDLFHDEDIEAFGTSEGEDLPFPFNLPTQGANSGEGKRKVFLPRKAVYVLKSWLFAHVDNPYPTEIEKAGLCEVSGLQLSQVNNWFINSRRRVLKQVQKVKSTDAPNSSPRMSQSQSQSQSKQLSTNSISGSDTAAVIPKKRKLGELSELM